MQYDIIMFNMSSMYDWDRGIVNRNFNILNNLQKESSINRIISVDFFPVGIKKAAKHYLQNLLWEPKSAEMIYGDLTSVCYQKSEKIFVYSSIDSLFSWKTVAKELKRVEKILNLKNIVFWSYNPMFVEFIGKLNEKLFIFDTVDNWTKHPEYTKLVKKEKLFHNYQKIATEADIIFSVSKEMVEFFKKIDRHDHVYWIPNGVDFDYFNSKEASTQKTKLDHIDKPIVGYLGTIESRFDVELFHEIVKLNQDKHFALCGPIWKNAEKKLKEKLHGIENITFTGRVKHEEVPSYLNRFSVAIITHTQSELVKSMNPMKIYEYLAVGKPVVSTPAPGTEMFPDFVKTANNAITFSEYINSEIKNDSEELISRRKATVLPHSWFARTDKMLEIIKNELM